MKQNKIFKNVQSDSVRGGRGTSRVAIAEDGIAVLQIGKCVGKPKASRGLVWRAAGPWL